MSWDDEALLTEIEDMFQQMEGVFGFDSADWSGVRILNPKEKSAGDPLRKRLRDKAWKAQNAADNRQRDRDRYREKVGAVRSVDRPTIIALLDRGYSQREISRQTGSCRATVARVQKEVGKAA